MKSEEWGSKEYESLTNIFITAWKQACQGKGKERHASKEEKFEDQQICQLPRWQGSIDGPMFQAMKKCLEVNRLETTEAKIEELLGAINYIAAAIILLQERKEESKNTAPPSEWGFIGAGNN